MRKNLVFTSIHLIGMSLAFAAAILLYLTAQFEWSFNDFQVNKERIGLVYKSNISPNGKVVAENNSAPLASVLKAEMPGVEASTRMGRDQVLFRLGDKQISKRIMFVDPDFFTIFSFPSEQRVENALEDLNSIVLTEQMAANLFGRTDVIGQLVEVNTGDTWEQMEVTSVIKDTPSHSSIRSDAWIRFEKLADYAQFKDSWNHNNHVVFVLWKGQKVDVEAFSQQSRSIVSKYYQEESESFKAEGGQADETGAYMALEVLPFDQFHINSLGLGDGLPPFYPWILMMLGVLILFIASSNFVNLSIASSMHRSKEIGMRKTLGSSTLQLTLHLWAESLILCFISLLIGIALSWLVLPLYNNNMDYELKIQWLFQTAHLLGLGIGFLLISLFAGGYPAFLISKANTIETLKGKFKVGHQSSIRNLLTVFQFTIAILLISSTLIISNQLHFIKNQPLGYAQTEVISIPIGNEIDGQIALQRMKSALAQHKDVVSISASDINLGRGKDNSTSTSKISFSHEDRTIRTHWLRIDYDYLTTLGLTLVEGRDFNPQFGADSMAVLINEKMLAQLGGAQILNHNIPVTSSGLKVIGVVKDFHFQSLRNEVEPLTMFIHPDLMPLRYLFVRVQTTQVAQTLQEIENIWKEVHPLASIPASYLNENTANQYERDERFGNMIIGASILSIGIACMGLFAISFLMIQKRVKEIGVRKVLGASVLKVVLLLSKDIFKWVVLSFLIAAPLAWLLGNKWLETFAYREELHWYILALAGLMVMLIALSTVLFQSIKAAVANPVDSLRDE